MSKLNSNESNLKAAKLKEKLPRGWTVLISRRAAEYNKAHNLDKNSPERLPESRPVIFKVVEELNYTHRLWPFVLELLKEKNQIIQENAATLDQLLQESA